MRSTSAGASRPFRADAPAARSRSSHPGGPSRCSFLTRYRRVSVARELRRWLAMPPASPRAVRLVEVAGWSRPVRQRVTGRKGVAQLGVEPAPAERGLCRPILVDLTVLLHDDNQIMRRRARPRQSGADAFRPRPGDRAEGRVALQVNVGLSRVRAPTRRAAAARSGYAPPPTQAGLQPGSPRPALRGRCPRSARPGPPGRVRRKSDRRKDPTGNGRPRCRRERR